MNTTRHHINTAPTDGTIILGYWEDEESTPQPQIKCVEIEHELVWVTLDSTTGNWIECLIPSYWSPMEYSIISPIKQ